MLLEIYLTTVKFACLQKYSFTRFIASLSSTGPVPLHSASPSTRSIHSTVSHLLCSSVSLAFPQCFQGDKLAGAVLSCWELVITDHFLPFVTKAWPQWSTHTDITTQLCLFGNTAKQLKRQKRKTHKPSVSAKHSSYLLLSSTGRSNTSTTLLHTGLHSSTDAELPSFFQGTFSTLQKSCLSLQNHCLFSSFPSAPRTKDKEIAGPLWERSLANIQKVIT